MRHKRRANQVRSPSARGISAMAESTGLLELFVSALQGGVLRGSLRPQRNSLDQRKERSTRKELRLWEVVRAVQSGSYASSLLILLVPRHARRIFSRNGQPLKPKPWSNSLAPDP